MTHGEPTDPIQPQLPLLDEEHWGHLRDMHPDSFAFKQEFDAVNELSEQEGFRLLNLADVFVPEKLEPPEGFASDTLTEKGAKIPLDQFTGIIHSFAEDDSITEDVHTLTNDAGAALRLVDLRGHMTNSVRKCGPDTEVGQEQLDKAVYRQLLRFLDTGSFSNRVTVIKSASVFYAKRGSTKERAYFMLAQDELGEGIPTVVRIADTGDRIPDEQAIYRSVFKTSSRIQ